MTQKSEISYHILPVSATMVGVCMTVISLMQLAPKNRLALFADELLAVDGLLFLISTIMSYWTIRPSPSSRAIELWADRLFLVGMILMVVISFVVAFELFID